MFIPQLEAVLPKHLKITLPYSLLGDKWLASEASRGNPLSSFKVQSERAGERGTSWIGKGSREQTD